MATYRQIPEIFGGCIQSSRRLALDPHLRRDPADPRDPPGRRQVRRHALLARGDAPFTVAHASIVRMRMRPARRSCGTGPPESPIPGCRLAPLRDLRRDRHRTPSSDPRPERHHALGPRLDRRRDAVLRGLPPVSSASPCWRPSGAAAYGPAPALEYRRLLVPVVPGRGSDDALDLAASMAAERGARIAAVTVLEIPLDLPLSAELPEEERSRTASSTRLAPSATLRHLGDPPARAGRNAGAEIVQRRSAVTEIIVIGAPRRLSAVASVRFSGTQSTTC